MLYHSHSNIISALYKVFSMKYIIILKEECFDMLELDFLVFIPSSFFTKSKLISKIVARGKLIKELHGSDVHVLACQLISCIEEQAKTLIFPEKYKNLAHSFMLPTGLSVCNMGWYSWKITRTEVGNFQ